jgi:hypothetical protein
MAAPLVPQRPEWSPCRFDLGRRVRGTVAGVSAAGMAGGTVLFLLDPQLALLGVAMVLGWTKLVGL